MTAPSGKEQAAYLREVRKNLQPALADLFAHTTSLNTVRLSDADHDVVVRALEEWTDAGYAIILGRTSDGGALVFTLLAGDWRHKLYASNADELTDALARIESVRGVPRQDSVRESHKRDQ